MEIADTEGKKNKERNKSRGTEYDITIGEREAGTMKKQLTAVLLAGTMVFMTACGSAQMTDSSSGGAVGNSASASESTDAAGVSDTVSDKTESTPTNTPTPTPEESADTFKLNQSTDKHIQYVNKYIGMNAASVGYTSLGGDRRIEIGAGSMLVTFVTSDGTYVGVNDEDTLKGYVVTGQNIEPNTEVHIEFQKDDDGTEYDSLTDFMTYDHIDLAVKKTGEEGDGPALVDISGSPDKYTYYIRNYVGKNLGSIGYESLGGEFRDEYGDGSIKIDLVADDGSYIDPADKDMMKKYVVTAQSIEPNSEMKYTYQTDSDGNEYSFTDTQTYDAITLNVKTISGQPVVETSDSTTVSEDSSDVGSGSGESGAEESSSADDSKYEAIYNDYSKQLADKVQPLIDEYNTEAAGADLTKKAEISNQKVEALANLCNEGVEKMAAQMLSDGSDYDTYSTWSSKLYDDYMTDAQKIYDAYISSAM